MHGTCQVTVHLCLLLQGDGTGVSEEHSMGALSSATAAVNQRDDTAVSSIYSGSSTDDGGSAPLTPPSFTRVGGAPHWGETSAGTDLSYNHPQTAKYLMKATVRPKEKVGWAGGAGRGGVGSIVCFGQAYFWQYCCKTPLCQHQMGFGLG